MPKLQPAIKVSDLVIPEDYTLFADGVSQSMVNSFLKCRVKWLISLNKLRRKDGGINTGFGSLTHDILDKMYSGWMQNKKLPSQRKIAGWIEDFVTENAAELSGKSDEVIEKDSLLVEILMTEYKKFYKKDFNEGKIISVEQVFDYTENGVRHRGKNDGALKLKDNTNWLLEHKTKSRIMEDSIRQILPLDFQSLFYIKALEGMMEIPFKGVLYNVIRNPSGFGKKGESLNLLKKRFHAEVKKKPEHFFKRYPQAYSKADKKIFNKQLSLIFKDMQNVLQTGEIYRNHNSCIGIFQCEHLNACNKNQLAFYEKKKSWFSELEEDCASEKNKKRRTGGSKHKTDPVRKKRVRVRAKKPKA